MKTGWWSVTLKITVEGVSKKFWELDDCSQEHIIDEIREGNECGSLTTDDEKDGWWDAKFETTLEGEDVDFHNDLSECTVDHILNCIQGDSYCGEIIEEDDDVEEDDDELLNRLNCYDYVNMFSLTKIN